MQFLLKTGLFWCCLVLFAACDGIGSKTSIPRMPVNVTIDTRMGEFVHFTPEALNTFVTVDAKGYHYNGHDIPLPFIGAFGCGGVLVYVNLEKQYKAYDLACPYCYTQGVLSSCTVDAPFATCPHCDEVYELGLDVAFPTKGIGQESLRGLPLTYVNGVIIIRQ